METRKTILVVDEPPDIADLLRGVLTSAGHRVLVAPTVDVGVQILGAFRIGLVLTDALPPTDDGPGDTWADLDRLVRAAGAAPLALYAPDESERYADHPAHGFAARLTKPLDLAALLTLIGALLLGDGDHPTVPHDPAAAS